MEAKEKATISRPKNRNKDSKFPIIYQVLEIFKTGQSVTAYGLNRAVGFNDARKAISLLRGRGYPIQDRRLSDRRKVYSLPPDWKKIKEKATQSNAQLSLFDDGTNRI
jgi:hypothetical protein